jgi:hypothetical protein
MVQDISREVNNYLGSQTAKNMSRFLFVEVECSLPCLQEPIIVTYCDIIDPSPYCRNMFLDYLLIFLSTHICYNWFLRLGFPDQILYTFLIYFHVFCPRHLILLYLMT